MASTRQFCREPDYPVAIFFTYSFDPLFFERVSWADLGVGGSRRIVIAADAGQLAETMRRAVGQIAHLGRRYVLAETAAANVFHPKLIARLSERGGRVWIGSGNLTNTGWGGNRELAASWPIGPSEEDNGVWLDETLGAVSQVIRSTTFSDQLRDIREEIPWLSGRPPVPQISPVLLGMPGRPLAPQLADRWRGRHFDEVQLCTGSTDVDGAFLSWAHRTFGIKRATVCLSPAYASFDPASLAKLPIDIRIIAAAPEKYMHAKFYWFSGTDGNAAAVGSANCSAAAWLAGNVELIIPYDKPKAAEFESVLSLFKGPKQSPGKALTSAAKTDALPASAPRYRLVSLRLRSTHVIEALVDPPLSSDAQANLVIASGSGNVTIRLMPHARGLAGGLPQEFQLGFMTLFAHAVGISGGIPFTTEPRWVDNDGLLERAARARKIDSSLEGLSRRGLLGMSHQRILEAVQTVSAQLLDMQHEGSGAVPALSTLAASKGPNAMENAIQAPLAVDPSVLIRSLNEIRRKTPASFAVGDSSYGGGLSGVIGMLFEQKQPEDIDLTRETWSAAEPEKNQEDPEPPPPPPPKVKPVSEAALSLEALSAFRDELKHFLHELAKPAFAATCDAQRMVQAVAFPLLLCIRGGEAGWLPSTELAAVATRVTNILFDRIYEREKPRGLFATVRCRYTELGQLDDFLRNVGDGTLWSVLLAALSIDPTAALRTVLPQAAALASVFHCRELLAYSDAARLSGLIRNLVIQNAEHNITEKAHQVAQAIAALIAVLVDRWETLFQEQGSGRQLLPSGSLLWSRNWGWFVTATSPAQAYHSGYIHVETAAADHPEIQEAVMRVFEASR